jgi:S1-C subfamily serine protease
VRPGDIITAINGKDIGSAQQLHNVEGLTPLGTALKVELLREGERIDASMTLKEASATTLRGGDLDPRLAGVQLADLDSSQQRPGLSGSVARSVERSSRAYASGLRSGDVIIAVNQREIEDSADLAALLQRMPRQLMLTVVRGRGVYYLLLQ